MNFLDPRLPSRIWNKLDPEPNTGCWLWTAATDRYGYPQTIWKNRKTYVHRLTLAVGLGRELLRTNDAGKRMVVDHRVCSTPLCCNPNHLTECTQQQNILREPRSSPDTCPAGHDKEPRRPGSKQRRCMECRRIYNRAYKRQLREAKRATATNP